MFKCKFAAEARNDMQEIRYFTRQQWGLEQSVKYIEGLRAKIKQLAENPHLGIERSREFGDGIYSCLAGNHTIYYSYDDNKIFIWAVLHQSMSPAIHLHGRNSGDVL